jgi:hypothetical protein
MKVLNLKSVCNCLRVKHVHRMSVLSYLKSHPCMANMHHTILEVHRYVPFNSLQCYVGLNLPLKIMSTGLNVIWNLGSVRGAQTVSVYHSHLHLCSGINQPPLVILLWTTQDFAKSFTISAHQQIFWGSSNNGRWDRQDIEPTWRW